MGLKSAEKVVICAKYYDRRFLLQPENHEWVIAIEATCVDGHSLLPYVIFAGKVRIVGWFGSNLPSDW